MANLSYAHGTSLTSLLGQTIGSNFRASAEKFADREALVVCWQKKRLTYRDLGAEVTECARWLLKQGIQKGDRVGIWAPNRYEWVVIQYATACVGAILVNVNPAYLAPELEYVLNQAEVRLLIYARGFKQNNYVEMLSAVQGKCSTLESSWLLESDWQQILESGRQDSLAVLEEREAGLHFDDPINIQYTSGTTGFPKGATLTHHNLLNNAYTTGEILGYTEHDRVCIPVPFYHCFGMVLGNLCCTSHGCTMVVPSESFQTKPVLEAVQSERCTSLYGVPTMFRAVLEDADFHKFDVSSLRTGIMAGAPCPIELMNEVVSQLHIPEVVIGYGMTETSPISTMSARSDAIPVRVRSVGRVIPHVEISIQDQSGSVLERGQTGEFCTRGYSVMRGYWNNPDATKNSIDAAGWMHSGDLALMDDQGYVRIVGRLKDMIIRGGENIYPAEIEAVLHTHPDISEAYVVGVPCRKYGEQVMAWVKSRPNMDLNTSMLHAFCQNRMAHYKIPRHWQFTDQFPQTVTGKVQKYRLREMAVQLLGKQHEEEETA